MADLAEFLQRNALDPKPQAELRSGDPAAFREPTLLNMLLGRFSPSGLLSSYYQPETREGAAWARKAGGLMDDLPFLGGLRSAGREAIKPPLPAPQEFAIPIGREGTGSLNMLGSIKGRVSGDTAHISEVYRNRPPGYGPLPSDVNSVGHRDMQRAADALFGPNGLYPHTAHVTAQRVSGARHGPARQAGSAPGLQVEEIIERTPLWEQILNEYGRRGIR
jgi:hypothetical protein